MSTRKCAVCNGTGSLWGTPKLIEEGGLVDSSVNTLPIADSARPGYGTDVPCWRCLGRGYMPQDNRDEGATNG